MNKEYTEEQLEEAKQYLRERINAELSMEHDVDVVLALYIPRLIGMLMRGASREDLDEIIKEIVDRLLEDCYILGVDERTEREDEIIAYINMERDGHDIGERFAERCDTLVNELSTAVAAGELLNLDEQSILSSVNANLKHPFDNEVIKAVKIKIARGEIDADLEDFATPSYGQGVPVSSHDALQMIGAYAIADAWMWDLFQVNKNKSGYYVFRGSSYPCDTCDEAVISGFHPITDTSHLVPLHPHCRCYVVFV